MTQRSQAEQAILDLKVVQWTDEVKRLAAQIAQAKGTNFALVMITGTHEEYVDVIPELILEDAMRVNPHGWPEGFSVDLLNPTN